MNLSPLDSVSYWREKKKHATAFPSRLARSTIVRAIVDLPIPASPLTQYTGTEFGDRNQSIIESRTVTRVPLRHLAGECKSKVS